jgi:hypothetical protein
MFLFQASRKDGNKASLLFGRFSSIIVDKNWHRGERHSGEFHMDSSVKKYVALDNYGASCTGTRRQQMRSRENYRLGRFLAKLGSVTEKLAH